MKKHEERFEMTPPSYFTSMSKSYLRKGTREREWDVQNEERDRILDYCQAELTDAIYPFTENYLEGSPGSNTKIAESTRKAQPLTIK